MFPLEGSLNTWVSAATYYGLRRFQRMFDGHLNFTSAETEQHRTTHCPFYRSWQGPGCAGEGGPLNPLLPGHKPLLKSNSDHKRLWSWETGSPPSASYPLEMKSWGHGQWPWEQNTTKCFQDPGFWANGPFEQLSKSLTEERLLVRAVK